MKPILCCVLLAISAAHAEPRHFSANSATIASPKARSVANHPTTSKVYVSISAATTVAKGKSGRTTKNANSTTLQADRSPATTADNWHFIPKFEDGGKGDTTYGFMLKHQF